MNTNYYNNSTNNQEGFDWEDTFFAITLFVVYQIVTSLHDHNKKKRNQ